MTRIVIKKIVWDEWNVEHIKKHNVTSNEVENAVKKLITHRKTKKNRYALFARSGKRILTIIVRRIESNTYYLVSARDAAKKERAKVYEKESK